MDSLEERPCEPFIEERQLPVGLVHVASTIGERWLSDTEKRPPMLLEHDVTMADFTKSWVTNAPSSASVASRRVVFGLDDN